MKVGICVTETISESGGAGSFNDTILSEINELKKEYDIAVCYQGSLRERPAIYEQEGVQYINVRAYRYRHTFRYIRRRARIRRENFRRWMSFQPPRQIIISWYDDIAVETGIDIYWFTGPMYAALTTPYLYTVWDLGHRTITTMPEVSRPIDEWLAREEIYQNMIPRAAAVLTGNETGKQEIMENYSVSANKIRIVPFEVSSYCRGDSRKPDREMPERYFLYPAQFWPHKNHIRILEALKLLRDHYQRTPNVIFCGSDKRNGTLAYIQEMAKTYHLEKQVHFLGFVSDEEMKWLYEHADALVYASILGPNNLPPIEALYLGCPVIISGIEGHREQMGDAALYFDAFSGDSLCESINEFMTNEVLQTQMKGRLQRIRKEQEGYRYIQRISEILRDYQNEMKCWKTENDNV